MFSFGDIPLKIAKKKVLPKEMDSMTWASEGGSKGHSVVVPSKGAATLPNIVILLASHLVPSNCVDYMWFLYCLLNYCIIK